MQYFFRGLNCSTLIRRTGFAHYWRGGATSWRRPQRVMEVRRNFKARKVRRSLRQKRHWWTGHHRDNQSPSAARKPLPRSRIRNQGRCLFDPAPSPVGPLGFQSHVLLLLLFLSIWCRYLLWAMGCWVNPTSLSPRSTRTRLITSPSLRLSTTKSPCLGRPLLPPCFLATSSGEFILRSKKLVKTHLRNHQNAYYSSLREQGPRVILRVAVLQHSCVIIPDDAEFGSDM